MGDLDITELEYIGSINEAISLSRVPEEELTSNFLEAGTKIYRIDEESIYVEYSFVYERPNSESSQYRIIEHHEYSAVGKKQ